MPPDGRGEIAYFQLYFPHTPHHSAHLPPSGISPLVIHPVLLIQAQKRLTGSIEKVAAQLMQTADNLVDDHHFGFKGIDFSLAPHPDQACSIGAAIEQVGIGSVGGSGSLFAAAFLTDAIRQVNMPHYGFSGLMLPVLEDSVLARRAECSIQP